jgi:membrane protein DedA with SNARE-associated domain
LWSFILSFAGRLLGEQWPIITDFINTYQNVVLVVGFLAVVAFVAYRLIRKKKAVS